MTRLSARQYQMARALSDAHHVSTAEAARWNQTTFNSFARRQYVKPTANGFSATKDLSDALQEFHSVEIYRKAVKLDLGRWAKGMLDAYRRKHARQIHEVA